MRSFCSGAIRPKTEARSTSPSSSASDSASRSAPCTGWPPSSPACRASAATVPGSSPESTLRVDALAGQPLDGLGHLRAQLVGERDHAPVARARAAAAGRRRRAGERPASTARAKTRTRRPERRPARPPRRSRPDRRAAARERPARRAPTRRRRCRSALHRSAELNGDLLAHRPRLARAGRGQRGRRSGSGAAALRAIEPSCALDRRRVGAAERPSPRPARAARWSACRSCRCRRRRRCSPTRRR